MTLKLKKVGHIWPIDPNASRHPPWFKGWPGGKRFAFIITHDVEHGSGLAEGVDKLLAIDKKYSIASSVGLVPERYRVDPETLGLLRKNRTEIYIHDLKHDGKLFSSYRMFHERVPQINRYIRQWKVDGFRAGAMHHNLDWIAELDIKYDMSTFDSDPFEPMPDGVGTIFPFIAPAIEADKCYVEIPYTLPQDLTTLILHPKPSIDIWIKKIDWIATHNGMASLNVHPDYVAFGNEDVSFDTYRAAEYEKFLTYIQEHYGDEFWNPLPGELSTFVNEESGRTR